MTDRRENKVELKPDWYFCPECGSLVNRFLDRDEEGGKHYQCERCYQEWYSDIDYTDCVQSNLSSMWEKLRTEVPDEN